MLYGEGGGVLYGGGECVVWGGVCCIVKVSPEVSVVEVAGKIDVLKMPLVIKAEDTIFSSYFAFVLIYKWNLFKN